MPREVVLHLSFDGPTGITVGKTLELQPDVRASYRTIELMHVQLDGVPLTGSFPTSRVAYIELNLGSNGQSLTGGVMEYKSGAKDERLYRLPMPLYGSNVKAAETTTRCYWQPERPFWILHPSHPRWSPADLDRLVVRIYDDDLAALTFTRANIMLIASYEHDQMTR